MSGGAAAGADWAPSATIETLRLRASVMADIRGYFAEAGVLEVETPLLARNGATDPLASRCDSAQGFRNRATPSARAARRARY